MIKLPNVAFPIFAMADSSTKANKAGVDHANALVDAGKVNRGSWSFSAEDGNKLLGDNGDNWGEYSKAFLGTHPDESEKTKSYYCYPVSKGGEVYRNAVVSAKGRAAQQGAKEVEDACSSLLDKIDKNSETSNRFRAQTRPTFFAKAKGTTGELYLYEDIGDGWFGGTTANSVAQALKDMGSVDVLDCYVNSAGGSVFEGVAIYNQLKRFPGKKVMHVDALAASIASIICMAGDEIHMAPNAQMMIHDPWGMAVGTADEMRKNAEALDQVKATLLDTYVRRTKGDRAQIEKWMSDETWMTAEMCLARGFCDQIDDEGGQAMDAVASPLLDRFKNTPRHLRDASRDSRALLARMQMRVQRIRGASAATAG